MNVVCIVAKVSIFLVWCALPWPKALCWLAKQHARASMECLIGEWSLLCNDNSLYVVSSMLNSILYHISMLAMPCVECMCCSLPAGYP